jgi:hypothetical protein
VRGCLHVCRLGTHSSICAQYGDWRGQYLHNPNNASLVQASARVALAALSVAPTRHPHQQPHLGAYLSLTSVAAHNEGWVCTRTCKDWISKHVREVGTEEWKGQGREMQYKRQSRHISDQFLDIHVMAEQALPHILSTRELIRSRANQAHARMHQFFEPFLACCLPTLFFALAVARATFLVANFRWRTLHANHRSFLSYGRTLTSFAAASRASCTFATR